MAQGKEGIQIYLRVRPTGKPTDKLSIDEIDNAAEFNIPRSQLSGYVNNARENYKFKFTGIVGMQAKQEEVFERVARKVIESALDGINGCVFAYGQTGSGKTFTITGGPERYTDRGLIPRTISFIFSELAQRSDTTYTIHISYLEIYQNQGYDLLDSAQDTSSMEDLPRVSLMEDEDGRFHLRNLSAHRASTEEDALNLLFMGDTNRMISETPMNMASSRSHCIFTVSIEARKAGEATVRRSKLHLVDLAGSERVSRTGVEGQTLSEAKHINMSLHHLQAVIVALQERSQGKTRAHIPYRNSMMTSVLRDSLGGNCRTAMVATVSAREGNIDESISTCRFATRVACISNEVMVNEELDPTLVIQRLKTEIRDLKEEVKLLKGGEEERGPLTPDEKERLRGSIVQWVRGDVANLPLGGNMIMIRAAFDLFKDMCRNKEGDMAIANGGTGGSSTGSADLRLTEGAARDVVKKLKLQVQQRDNEINILVSMLKKLEEGRPGAAVGTGGAPQPPRALVAPTVAAPAPPEDGSALGGASGPGASSAAADASAGAPGNGDGSSLSSVDLLADRTKAFEVFRKSYRRNQAIDENKAVLRTKYAEAKSLGEAVNGSRTKINAAKSQIEAIRKQQAARGVAQGEGASLEVSPQEQSAREEIEREKVQYKQKYHRLRELKSEIDHLHKLLEQSRLKMQTDFEAWMRAMSRQAAGAGGGSDGASRPASARSTATARAPAQPQFAYAASATTHVDKSSRPKQAWAEPSEEAIKSAGPMLTGNAEADADIMRFYAAREKLMKARAS